MSVQVSFKQDFNIGRISDKNTRQRIPGYTDVQCFPIYSYLLALNITHVDYFSLDVEGDELDVLMTLPFDKVNIEVRDFVGPVCKTIDPYINCLCLSVCLFTRFIPSHGLLHLTQSLITLSIYL